MEKAKQLIDPAEQEIRMSFHNYKLLKKEEFSLKGSHIYFIKGPNNVGKTSILNALRAVHEMKDDTPKKVTLGETEGVNEFTIPGPDGNTYTVVYEFTDNTTKFVMYDEDGNKISKVSDMRDVFRYNHVDADAFISWSRTAEGRRKQKELILQLLPADQYIKYTDLEKQEKTIFDQRTNAGKEKENFSRMMKEFELTSEEQTIADNKDRAKEALKALEKELDDLTQSDVKRSALELQLANLKSSVKGKNDAFLEYNNNAVAGIDNANNRIVEYQRQIEELKKLIQKETDGIKKMQDLLDAKKPQHLEEIKAINASIESVQAEIDKLPKVTDPIEHATKTSLLESKIAKAKDYIDKAAILQDKRSKFKMYKKQFEDKSSYYDELDADIIMTRKEKEDIIVNGDFPVDNLTFDEDGYLYIGGLKFDEKQICESDTILLVAQLLCKMNATPIQIIGDASVLDFTRLDKLYDIAEKNGKIMFVDEIDRNLEKLVIVGYEKHDKSKKKNEKKLDFEL